MKLVYTNESSFLVNNIKNLIEAEQINAFIKNEYAQGAMGDISVFDTWPEVWVYDDTDLAKALDIVKRSQNKAHLADWVCQHCGESNDASFEICWHCQNEHEK